MFNPKTSFDNLSTLHPNRALLVKMAALGVVQAGVIVLLEKKNN